MTNGKRGPKKQYTHQTTVRLETEYYEYLKARAEREGVSIAEVLRELVETAARYERERKPPGRPPA